MRLCLVRRCVGRPLATPTREVPSGVPAAGGVIGAGAGVAAGRAATQDHVEAAEKTTVGTGEVGLSATAFPSFQGPWAGLDVPGDIWLATTVPALPTRTQHAVSTARLHPSFLPSGVSRTIEPRQAGRPVAGRPARGGPKRHPRLGGQPRQRHAVLDMRAQQVPAAQRLAACARSASPAPAARARAAGSSTAGEPTSSRAQVVAGNAGFPATPGPGRTGSGPAEPHRRPRPASSTCTHSLRQTLLEAPSWARWSRSTTGRATTTPQESHQALKDQYH